MFILSFRPFSSQNRPTMLTCIDCHRINAPWAKKCVACGSGLHQVAPNTLIAGHPRNPAEEPEAVIKPWIPDSEWHAVDEVNGQKILDPHMSEPITVIEPSRTSEIDWGDTSGAAKFDSLPFPGASKDRFDEYGYDFEKTKRPGWKSAAVLLSGIAGILLLGGLAIGYLHSTTASNEAKTKALIGSSNQVQIKPKPSQQPEMVEEVISVPNAVPKVLPPTAAEPLATAPEKKTHAPVFVMSASEPINAPINAPVVEGAITKPPLSSPSTIPPPPLQSMPPPPTSKPSKPSIARVETKQPTYKVLVPVPQRTSDSTYAQTNDRADSKSTEAMNDVATPTVAPPTSPRLNEKQSADCSNSAFLGKVLCEERARVSFCKNRWNEHPDCIVNSNRIDP
jgi:hypothetical protein